MAAVVPTDMFTNVLQGLGVLGASQTAPTPEDTEYLRRLYNRIFSRWNTKRGLTYFIETQQLTFTATKQTYTIGLAANTPDFTLQNNQDRPSKLEDLAQLIITNNIELQLGVINWDIYKQIPAPTLTGNVPQAIYYQPTTPNGTIWIWLEPTNFAYKLQIHWRHQITQMSDVTATLQLPDGWEDAMTLTLMENAFLAFPKRTNLEEIKRLARKARADIMSNNLQPPHIDLTGGAVESTKGGFNWRTHLPG